MQRDDVTVIVPTHNRQNYLPRVVCFLEYLNVSSMICDSTKNKYNGDLKTIKYYHTPEKSFQEKILYVTSLVTTPLITLCADDDFLDKEQFEYGVDCLIENPEFTSFVGGSGYFFDDAPGNYYKTRICTEAILSGLKEDNAQFLFSHYQNVLWSIHTKDVILKSFTLLSKANPVNHNFIEMIIAFFSCDLGYVVIDKRVLNIRELSSQPHWGDMHKPVYNIDSDAEIQNDFIKIHNLLDDNSSKFFQFCLETYIKRYKPKSSLLRRCVLALCPWVKNIRNLFLIKRTQNRFDRYRKVLDFDQTIDLKETQFLDSLL